MKREPEEVHPPSFDPTAQDRGVPTFTQIQARPLLSRLTSEFAEAYRRLMQAPGLFLKGVLVPEKPAQWFPIRLGRQVRDASVELVRHPLRAIGGALTPDAIGLKRRRSLMTALGLSWLVHGGLIIYLIYAAIVAPYIGIKIVDVENYGDINADVYLKKLYYPEQLLIAEGVDRPKSLEEIEKEKAERKRREELRRKEEEKKKEELAKKAEEEKKKAELEAAAAKEAAAKQAASQKTFGEINVAPIKDIIGNLYQMYESGNLDLSNSNFKIMCSFKIMPDGSIPKDSIKVILPSKSKVVDKNAIEILWRLGQSHALGPLCSLSSNTIELEVNDNVAKLTITSFAQTPEDAKSKVQQLNFLLGILKFTQKQKNPVVAELLDHLKLTYDNKRIDADMTVPKSRATVMMDKQFGKGNNQH